MCLLHTPESEEAIQVVKSACGLCQKWLYMFSRITLIDNCYLWLTVKQTAHWWIQEGGAKDARPWDTNSLILMQFSPKKLKNDSIFGSRRTPSEKSWIRQCCWPALLVVQHVISWHKSIRLSLLILCFINKLSRILFCFYWVGRGSFNLTLSSFLSNLNVAIRRLQVEPPWPSV